MTREGLYAKWVGGWAAIKRLARHFSRELKPFGAACTIAFAVGTVARSAEIPTRAFWSHRGAAWGIVAVGAVAAVRQTIVYIDRKNRKRSTALDDGCQAIAAYIEAHCPNIPLRDVGVHVWVVVGPRFAPRLERAASFLIRPRRASSVTWTKGKGVFGVCWKERASVIVDLETELYARAATKAAFDLLPAEERFGLEWDELRRTRHYKTIFAAPLFDRAQVNPQVRGIAVVDILSVGHFQELAAVVQGDRDFNAILGVCEGALIG